MKGVRISEEQKVRALELYAHGKTYAEIEASTGVSRAALTPIVRARAGEDPDAVATHQLARILKEKNEAPEKLLRGVAAVDAIEEMGSNLDEVKSAILPVVKQFGPNTVEMCKRALEYSHVVEETGFTHAQLLAEHGKKTVEVRRMIDDLAKGGLELESLDQKISAANSRLDDIADLEKVKRGLEKIDRAPGQAAATVEEFEKILDTGLSINSLEQISIEVKRIEAKVPNVPRTIARLLAEHGTLDSVVKQTKKSVTRLERDESRLERRVGSLKIQKLQLNGQCRKVKSDLKVLRNDHSSLSDRMENRVEEQNKVLERHRESFETELAIKKEQSRKEFEAMDDTHKKVEKAHGEDIISLETKKIGLETEVATLGDEVSKMSTKIEANKALSRFLWWSYPSKMHELFPALADKSKMDSPLSDPVRIFLLDSILEMVVDDAAFWSTSLERCLKSGRQRSLAAALSRVYGEKLALESQIANLKASMSRQEETLVSGYPTWKVLNDDPIS